LWWAGLLILQGTSPPHHSVITQELRLEDGETTPSQLAITQEWKQQTD